MLEAARSARPATFDVLAVTYKDFRSDAIGFTDRLGVTYPALYDADGAVAGRYGVSGIPQTLFIDADGVVRDRVYGITSKAALDEPLDAIAPTVRRRALASLLPAEVAGREQRRGDRPHDEHDELAGRERLGGEHRAHGLRERGGREQLGDRFERGRAACRAGTPCRRGTAARGTARWRRRGSLRRAACRP